MDSLKIAALGTIVTWGSPASISLSDLRSALQSAGLDPVLARDLLPRNAFSRAAKELEEGRIIAKVSEDDTTIRFQFTKAEIRTDEIVYDKEAVLTLVKSSGLVSCSDYALQTAAQNELDKQMGQRNAGDVTRLVQKLFDQHKGDLVPLRKNGGVYFVPNTHQALVEQVWDFLLAIGGRMSRFTVNSGDAATEISVADSLTDHFQSMLADLHHEIGEVDMESSEDAIKRRHEKIALLKAKLGSYQFLMEGTATDIAKQIKLAEWEYNNRLGLPNDWEPTPEDLPALETLMGAGDGT